MNSNIYRCKFLFIFFVCVTLLSCGEKVIYDKLLNVLKIQENVDNKIKKKETGIFSYPKFGFSFSLKKGKFNGPFKIITQNNDTILYINFVNDKINGYYQFIDYRQKIMYPYNFIFTTKYNKFIKFYGKGYVSSEEKKEGYWIEPLGRGSYISGKKEGYWEEWDIEGYILKKGMYVNNQKEKLWKEDIPFFNIYTEGIYINNKKEGIWIERDKDTTYKLELLYLNDRIKDTLNKILPYP